MNDSSCVFCRIAQKQAPGSIIYENETVMAFLDTRPLSEGHTLVIPKEHYKDIFDTPEEVLCHAHKISRRIALALKKAFKVDGISIFQQNGRAANQEILHLHVHVVPRYEGKKLGRFAEFSEANRETLDKVAAEINRYL
jgi:histidine triad (HIT) family protein